LRAAVDAADIEVLDEAKVSTLATGAGEVTAKLGDAKSNAPQLSARLVACAEGALTGAMQDVVERDYDQHAIIARVTPEGGHGNLAFERFTPSGPIALLPCVKDYALVHVVPPQTADALLELDDASYLAHLQARFGSRVRLSAVTGRLRFPLGLRYRREPTGQRTVWLGNAAQTLHPVAGQGFNLALRDVHALAETLMNHPGDPGSAATLAAYAGTRKLDRSGTIHFTDALVRLFSNDAEPLRHLRGAGLFALDVLPPLRHFIARRMMFGARAWP
jgi:2-octaprenyl-6-methoxyphenol hydroxylase